MLNVELAPLRAHLQRFLAAQGRRLLVVRSAESMGSLSGTLTGWSDVKLSEFGRRQAFTLSGSGLPDFKF